MGLRARTFVKRASREKCAYSCTRFKGRTRVCSVHRRPTRWRRMDPCSTRRRQVLTSRVRKGRQLTHRNRPTNASLQSSPTDPVVPRAPQRFLNTKVHFERFRFFVSACFSLSLSFCRSATKRTSPSSIGLTPGRSSETSSIFTSRRRRWGGVGRRMMKHNLSARGATQRSQTTGVA